MTAAAEALDAVDDAYRAKYADRPCPVRMIASGPRAATVRVEPAS